MGLLQKLQSRGQSRVQLRERAAHGGGGERGGLHGVHGSERAGLRQQRRDHRGPQDARQPLLRVQHHRPLRRRDEARRHRRRLLVPRLADPDDTKNVANDPYHALHDADDPYHALHDADHADHHHALHDADVLWRWRHHVNPGDPGHDSVHVIPQRGRPRSGDVGWLWPGLVYDRAASAALDTRWSPRMEAVVELGHVACKAVTYWYYSCVRYLLWIDLRSMDQGETA